MRLLRTLVPAILFGAVLAGPASAQLGDVAAMKAFQTTPYYGGLIHRAMASLPPAVFQSCAGLKSAPSSLLILRPVSFAPDGMPAAGQWMQGFPVSGCGNDTRLNFLFFVSPPGKLHVVVTAPGETRADIILQRDAFGYAMTSARIADKACADFTVINTKFDRFGLDDPPTPDPGPIGRLRPWQETWTMAGCGRQVGVPIGFIPNAGGTQILQVIHPRGR